MVVAALVGGAVLGTQALVNEANRSNSSSPLLGEYTWDAGTRAALAGGALNAYPETAFGGGDVANPEYAAWQQRQQQAQAQADAQYRRDVASGMDALEAASRRSLAVASEPAPPQTIPFSQAYAQAMYGEQARLMSTAQGQADYGQQLAAQTHNRASTLGNEQRMYGDEWGSRANDLQRDAMTAGHELAARYGRIGTDNARWMEDSGMLYDRQMRSGATTAAQQQLQAGTNRAVDAQTSMARSSGDPRSMYAARNNAALIQQQGANAGAQLMAQEQQSMRGDIAQQQAMRGQETMAMDQAAAAVQRGNIDAQNAYRFGLLDRAQAAAGLQQGANAGAQDAYRQATAGYALGAQYGALANQTRGAAGTYGSRGDTAVYDATNWERQKAMAQANAATEGMAQQAGYDQQMAMYRRQQQDQSNAALIAGGGQVLSGLAQYAAS